MGNDSVDKDMDAFEKESWNVPPLPSKFLITFRCRDCECSWKLAMELPALIKVFYEQNRRCYSCNNMNIEMDIIPAVEE